MWRSSIWWFSQIWLQIRYESRGKKSRILLYSWLPTRTYHKNLATSDDLARLIWRDFVDFVRTCLKGLHPYDLRVHHTLIGPKRNFDTSLLQSAGPLMGSLDFKGFFKGTLFHFLGFLQLHKFHLIITCSCPLIII